MRLYLQYNWELLRWVSVLYAHRQPHLKRCQLLCEERTVLWTQEAMKYLSPFQIIYSASAFSLFQMDTHTHTHAHNEVVLQLQAHHFIKT